MLEKKIRKMTLPPQKIVPLRLWGQVFQFYQMEFDWECRVRGMTHFPRITNKGSHLILPNDCQKWERLDTPLCAHHYYGFLQAHPTE